MKDTIYRQDAIDAINNDIMGGLNYRRILRELPSAEPEQKRGTWQRRKGSDCWECSQCHAVLENDDLGMHNFYFCYHCGANMMNKMGYMDIEEVHYE